MRYIKHIICIAFLFLGYFMWGQDPAIKIVYENRDAFNGLKKNPSIATYLRNVGEYKSIEGKQRSTLRLYDYVGIYTVDSVYVTYSGYRSKSWTHSIVNIRNYNTSQKFSIYSDLPHETAYLEKDCESDLVWTIDKSKTRTILGLNCYYARAEISNNLHQIWFTNDLPYKDGPFLSKDVESCHLPGLVLEHIMGDGYTTTAIDVDFVESNASFEEKVNVLKPWTTTPKPSYSPGDHVPESMILINETFDTNTWIRLKYTSDAQTEWILE